MRKTNRSYLLQAVYLLVFWLGQGCEKRNLYVSLHGGTKGTWEWVRTTTPSRTLTPQSVGYTQQLAVLSDGKGAYVGFYKNDTLQQRIDETVSQVAHTYVDDVRNIVTIQYGKAGFLKYYITPSTETITVSALLENPYTTSADSVRNVYKRTSKSLYPY